MTKSQGYDLQLGDEQSGDGQRLELTFEAVFASAADAIVIIDAKGIVAKANPAAILTFGFDPRAEKLETIARRLSARYPDGRPVVFNDAQSSPVLRGEKEVGTRLIVTNAEGKDRTIMASFSPLISDGRILGMVATWHDITERERLIEQLSVSSLVAREAAEREQTAREELAAQNEEIQGQHEELQTLNRELELRVAERTYELLEANEVLRREITERKRAEEELRGSEGRYRTLVETSPDAVALIDLETKILMCNPQTAKLLGFEKTSEVLGKNALQFFPEEEHDRVIRAMKTTLRMGVVRNLDLTLLRKDGHHVPVEISGAAVLDAEGKPRSLLALARDITERKQNEEVLRHLRRDWEDIFQSIGDPTMVLDPDHRILAANRALVKAIGVTQEELLGKHCYEVVHQTAKPIEGCPMEMVLTSNHPSRQETELEVPGGTSLVSCTPVFDETGRIEKVIHVTTDVTSLKAAERQLKQSFDLLQMTLQGTIEAMASTVEIRDPYTAGHQRRVAMLACAIAEEMGLTETQRTGLRLAASIHDIGKIGVPAEILSKPGRLTATEFSLIRTHCQIGYDILKRIEFPWPIAQIVLQHHERVDGSGYPSGQAAEGTLIEARILAVSDAVEAMASHRPYRPSLGIVEALQEIKVNRGILYDSDVVDACLKLFADSTFSFA